MLHSGKTGSQQESTRTSFPWLSLAAPAMIAARCGLAELPLLRRIGVARFSTAPLPVKKIAVVGCGQTRP